MSKDTVEIANELLAKNAALEARVKELEADKDRNVRKIGELSHALAHAEADVKEAEAELTRLKAQEPVRAVVKHYTGCSYPVIKINSLEVVIAGGREDAEDLADYINSLHCVPAEPRPAVLPPEMVAEPEKHDVIDHGFINGYNKCRADALALGCQPQRFVVSDNAFRRGLNALNDCLDDCGDSEQGFRLAIRAIQEGDGGEIAE